MNSEKKQNILPYFSVFVLFLLISNFFIPITLASTLPPTGKGCLYPSENKTYPHGYCASLSICADGAWTVKGTYPGICPTVDRFCIADGFYKVGEYRCCSNTNTTAMICGSGAATSPPVANTPTTTQTSPPTLSSAQLEQYNLCQSQRTPEWYCLGECATQMTRNIFGGNAAKWRGEKAVNDKKPGTCDSIFILPTTSQTTSSSSSPSPTPIETVWCAGSTDFNTYKTNQGKCYKCTVFYGYATEEVSCAVPTAAYMKKICQCQVNNTCTDLCVFNAYSDVSYAKPQKCTLDDTYEKASTTHLNEMCNNQKRTQGDTNADGIIDIVDVAYYLLAKDNAQNIPTFVNPDFDGDGKINSLGDIAVLSKVLESIKNSLR